MKIDGRERGYCEDGTIEGHDWTPLSFVFESQLLDQDGRVSIRQPAIDAGRVYCVCMKCHQHTYIVTQWAGFWLPSERWGREHPDDDGEAVPA